MITLRHRFFLAILAGAALTGLFLIVVATTLFTPRVAHRLAQQQAQIRLLTLIASLPREQEALLKAYGQSSAEPAWQGVELVARDAPSPARQQRSTLLVRAPIPDSSYDLQLQTGLTLRRTLSESRPLDGRGPLLLGIAVLCIYGLSLALSRYVTRPLQELESAVTELAEGGREVTVAPPKERELAKLATAFNLMTKRLWERQSDLDQTMLKLEKALAAKEKIFANTSHELRTPLTVILGYTQLLQDGLKGPLNAEQARSLRVIEKNASSLLSQVEDLLTLSRLQAGQLPIRPESVDLRDLAEEVVSHISPRFGEQRLSLEWSREGAFSCTLDYQRGCQILTNLLENARKYAEGAAVTVSVREEGSRLEVEVSDSGPGVPAELCETLFLEFERGPAEAEGAGLGLALARGLARQLGGDLTHEPQRSGACFRWTVPQAAS